MVSRLTRNAIRRVSHSTSLTTSSGRPSRDVDGEESRLSCAEVGWTDSASRSPKAALPSSVPGVFVIDGDTPAMRASDIADWRLAFVPDELASIEDTWDAGGLRRRVAPKEVGVRAARLRRRLTKNPLPILSFVAAWRQTVESRDLVTRHLAVAPGHSRWP